MPTEATKKSILRSRLDPRTPSGITSILFWISLVVYIATRYVLFGWITGIFLAVSILVKIFPLKANILYARLLSMVTRGDERDVNAFFATLPKIGKMSTKQLNEVIQKPNELLQEAALSELKSKGNDQTVTILKDQAARADGILAVRMLDTLGHIAGPEHASDIVRFLDHDRPSVRGHAARCLSRMNAVDTTVKMVDVLSSESDPDAIVLLFESILQLGDNDILAARWRQLPSKTKMAWIDYMQDHPDDYQTDLLHFLRRIENDPEPEVAKAIHGIQRTGILRITRSQHPTLFENPSENKWVSGYMPVLMDLDISSAAVSLDGKDKITDATQKKSEWILSAEFNYQSQSPEDTDLLSFTLKPVGGSASGRGLQSVLTGSDCFEAFARSQGSLAAAYFLNCTESYRTAFFKQLFAANVQDFNDGRQEFDIDISGQQLRVVLKYALFFVYIALFSAERNANQSMHVCFKGLYDGDDWNEIPPFVVRFDVGRLLLENRETIMFSDEKSEMIEISSPRIIQT